jgi:hypothetical protein
MNHLKGQKSLYLIQHSNNPVDWYPWSESAFIKAKKENKPVFLSIGYSTCHWCHVMEDQCFNDVEVAKLMNDTFVNIKVDREERPDLDQIFMSVCVMLNGNGGWPLSIIMTPEKKPFFAATYIPKTGLRGNMGMVELIPFIKKGWNSKAETYREFAGQITEELKSPPDLPKTNREYFLDNIFSLNNESFESSYDNENGGFGFRPKFPSAHDLIFMLNQSYRNNKKHYREMVLNTLKKIRQGGIYDHIGFGFHRYSTDQKWKVPHFEKMIYDQAMLILAFAEVFCVTENNFYKKIAGEIIEYVTRDMTGDEGGFYSAEDADSEGKEGMFYLWSYKELQEILTENEQKLFFKHYNILESGNFDDEATLSPTGLNILYTSPEKNDPIAHDNTLAFEKIIGKMYEIRKKRIHPLKDDKILTNWNGLMIAALSKASMVFQNNHYYKAALKSAEFVSHRLLNFHNSSHRYRDGESAIEANLEDYAFYIFGLIHLYMAGFEVKWLKTANELCKSMVKKFFDTSEGGFFFITQKSFTLDKLFIRSKDFHDGALPSGNSVAFYDLIMLDRLTGNSLWTNEIELTIDAYEKQMQKYPTGYSFFLTALDISIHPGMEIVINGNKKNIDIMNAVRIAQSAYNPGQVIHQRNSENFRELGEIAPYTLTMGDPEKTGFHVCQDFTCQQPVTSVDEFSKYFKKKGAAIFW